MSLLAVKNLSLTINGTPILKDINISLAQGSILGVIGESGSGKSMTAFSVMNLLPSGSETTGQILLDGTSTLEADETELCNIRGNTVSIVFQEPMTALNPLKTIGDQVAETIRIHHPNISRDEALQRAQETLERCELPPQRFGLGLYPHELSGGQRQRVVIAMAIALRPKLLIADEPTTALDVTTQAEVLALLQRLVREDGMSMMLISHDLAVVAEMADNIVIMKDGEIVEQGPSETLFDTMSHPYSIALYTASGHTPARETAPQKISLLTVKDVVCEYRLPRKKLLAPVEYLRAVDHVNFEIRKGESLGLVGESGCGKSTLTRAILGLEPLRSGEILLNGETISQDAAASRNQRRQMQVVFQDPYGSFNPRHRVDRLVSEPFHLLDNPPNKAEKQDAISEVLRDVGLSPDDQFKFIHEFSGGQRQRIAIARALIIRPELILLDEATSALDVSIRAQILDLLAELADTHGLTYLFISHDLTVVRSITDRVLIMKSGKIVEKGETREVFQNPQHPYSKMLIEAAPTLPTAKAG